jgi:hypothetical protein
VSRRGAGAATRDRQPRVPISTDGGGSPRWRHDGKELFYIRGDNKLMEVDVSLHARNSFLVSCFREFVADPGAGTDSTETPY